MRYTIRLIACVLINQSITDVTLVADGGAALLPLSLSQAGEAPLLHY